MGIIVEDVAEATLLPCSVVSVGCLTFFLGELPTLQKSVRIFGYHSRSVFFQILLLKCPHFTILSMQPTLLQKSSVQKTGLWTASALLRTRHRNDPH